MDKHNNDIKTASLMSAIRKAGYEIGKKYYECNTEDYEIDDEESEEADDRPRLKDGSIVPEWLDEGFADQIGESLYGDSQADDIDIDSELFADEVNKLSTWDILEKYIGDDDVVTELFCKGWHDFLHEKYGALWPLDENSFMTH